MYKKLFLVNVLMMTGNLYAQSTIETSIEDAGGQTLEYISSHFKASYHGEFYGVRRESDQKINDIKIMHNPTLIYLPTENIQAMATAEFKFSDQPSASAGADYPNGFFRGLLTLTKKNILTEKENGVQLDLGIGRRQFNTGSAQSAGGDYALGSYGNNRIFANINKTLGKHSGSLLVQVLNNDYKVASAGTWKNGIELLPTLNFQLTDKLSYMMNDDIVINLPKFQDTDKNASVTHDMNIAYLNYQWNDAVGTYLQIKYNHDESFSDAFQSQDDYFSQYIGVGYSFNPKSTITFEVGSELAHARDGKKLLSDKIRSPELAMYVDLAI